jgi:hypothetical protein
MKNLKHILHRNVRAGGQALVEFALAATLIFLLLAATIDLGLMFFTLQGLHNAAQEGGMYGSRWILPPSGSNPARLDVDGIRYRVRMESGENGLGFANLLDLNADGIPDVDPVTGAKQINPATGNPVINDYIIIRALLDSNLDKNPLNDGSPPNYTPCPALTGQMYTCFLVVEVRADYRLLFPLVPSFADKYQLVSRFSIEMRTGS